MTHSPLKSLIGPFVFLALAACGGGGGGGSPAPEPQPASATAPAPGTAPGTATTPPAPAVLSSALTPDCSGTGWAACAAVNSNTYDGSSGSGIGVWRYNNTTGADFSFDVNIAGVAAGKTATLVFSNGSQAKASAPSSGVLTSQITLAGLSAEVGTAGASAPAQAGHDDGHAQMLEKNRAMANKLTRSRSTAAVADLASGFPGVVRLSYAPAAGTPRVWIDNFPATPVSYATKAQFVCTLPTGRNVVWWVDPNVVASGKFTQPALDAALQTMKSSYCGPSGSGGGLAQLTTQLGDVWGSAAAKYSDLILDTASLQDVNVVLLNVPLGTGWAGYFDACNNLLKASCSSSNEALAFFINANQLKSDITFTTSTLLHESTHMLNLYQRAVVRGDFHDTWLEETSAMMTEDIIAPAVIGGGYNKIMSVRLQDYLYAGGNVSFLNWPTLQNSSAHYGLGGGFGAFLNRRYGLAIYKQLVTSTSCSEAPATASAPARTSYDCLDGLIKANGGAGFSDEFSRFGATVFGKLPAAGAPAGYGYPSVTAGAYVLQANDLSATDVAAPVALASGYSATSQTFQRDTIAAGKTSYIRNSVMVPAGTTLTLTIK